MPFIFIVVSSFSMYLTSLISNSIIKIDVYKRQIEYNDSIKIKSDDLEISFDEETDEFD